MAPRKQSGPGTGARSAKSKVKTTAPKRRPAADPTRDAPFRIDIANDGDIASVRHDLSEDEIKEQADREKRK
ncbi:hypothetical protein [Bradyrhizobium sp. SYSU BS000235]|uniref:hypothetical protein n=1 Tax=Bradyrhizobium sp. SYSU BS000235 TaxID=3411332 RepID=UPI003C72DDA6